MDGKALRRFASGKVRRSTADAPQPQAPAASPSGGPPGAAWPGYTWAWMNNSYVMVPLPTAAPGMVTPAPPGSMRAPASPQQPSYGGNVIPIRPRSNFLVRDGGAGDLWAEKLEAFPELPVPTVPEAAGYDAMEGRMSPLAMKELQPLLNEDPEFRSAFEQGRERSLDVPRNFRPAPTLKDRGPGDDAA